MPRRKKTADAETGLQQYKNMKQDTAYRVTGSLVFPLTTNFETVSKSNINALNNAGMAPLHVALRCGNVDEAEKIVTLGANPFLESKPNSYGLLPVIASKTPEEYIRIFTDNSWSKDSKERGEKLRAILKTAQDTWASPRAPAAQADTAKPPVAATTPVTPRGRRSVHPGAEAAA